MPSRCRTPLSWSRLARPEGMQSSGTSARTPLVLAAAFALLASAPFSAQQEPASPLSAAAMQIGRAPAAASHLNGGDEFRVPLATLLEAGERLFSVTWTPEAGGGRPQTKGTG